MSNKKPMSSFFSNDHEISIQNIKTEQKKRTRLVYSFTDLVQKLFEKEQEQNIG